MNSQRGREERRKGRERKKDYLSPRASSPVWKKQKCNNKSYKQLEKKEDHQRLKGPEEILKPGNVCFCLS